MVDTESGGNNNNRQSGNLMTQQANHGMEPEYVSPNTKGQKKRVSYYQVCFFFALAHWSLIIKKTEA